jgi:hypothetical protein
VRFTNLQEGQAWSAVDAQLAALVEVWKAHAPEAFASGSSKVAPFEPLPAMPVYTWS